MSKRLEEIQAAADDWRRAATELRRAVAVEAEARAWYNDARARAHTTGVAVRRARESAGLSLRECARRAGVPASNLSDFETGAKPENMGPDKLVRVVAVIAEAA